MPVMNNFFAGSNNTRGLYSHTYRKVPVIPSAFTYQYSGIVTPKIMEPLRGLEL